MKKQRLFKQVLAASLAITFMFGTSTTFASEDVVDNNLEQEINVSIPDAFYNLKAADDNVEDETVELKELTDDSKNVNNEDYNIEEESSERLNELFNDGENNYDNNNEEQLEVNNDELDSFEEEDEVDDIPQLEDTSIDKEKFSETVQSYRNLRKQDIQQETRDDEYDKESTESLNTPQKLEDLKIEHKLPSKSIIKQVTTKPNRRDAGYAPYVLKGNYMYSVDPYSGAESLVKSKFVYLNGNRYYVGKNGRIFLGKRKFTNGREDYYYYFTPEDGQVKDKLVVADGGKYYAMSNGRLSLFQTPKKGWMGLGQKSYYFDNNKKMYRGFHDLGTNRYFFDEDLGHMIANKRAVVDGRIVTTNSRGVVKFVGFDYHNEKYTYNDYYGNTQKGLKYIDGKTYYFKDDGDMRRESYQKVGNQWYYFNKFGEGSKSSGNFKRGWDGWYYYHPDGKKAKGYTYLNGYLHYFEDKTGRLCKNFYGIHNGKQYYFGNNGVGTYIKTLPKKPGPTGTRGRFYSGFSRYDLNRKTPYYSQNDPRWSKTMYGQGVDTFGQIGCGPTALSMVLSRKTGRTDIYPTNVGDDIALYSGYGGTEWSAIKDYPKRYGYNTYEVPITKDALIMALRDNPVIIRVGNGYFINGGHFLVIDSYKNGKFYINDPFFYYRNTDGGHSWERIKEEATIAWMIK